jgi:hypothetical protein
MRFSKIAAELCVDSYHNEYSGTKGSSYYKRSSSCKSRPSDYKIDASTSSNPKVYISGRES